MSINNGMTSPTRPAAMGGLVQGTRVAGKNGWQAVETLVAGDVVLTADMGMQSVTAVQRRFLSMEDSGAGRYRLLHIPAGALGNHQDMQLLPDQMLHSETECGTEVESGTGRPSPFAAATLEGETGILGVALTSDLEIITLCFDQPRPVYSALSVCFICPASSGLVSEAA
jgi:Hint domain-containing protein